jgi:hypothetical protein
MNARDPHRSTNTDSGDDPVQNLAPADEESPLIPDAWSVAHEGRHSPAAPYPLEPRKAGAMKPDTHSA